MAAKHWIIVVPVLPHRASALRWDDDGGIGIGEYLLGVASLDPVGGLWRVNTLEEVDHWSTFADEDIGFYVAAH